MNALIETLNRFGEEALHFAWPMLWQSSVLIVVLLVADFALHRHVRAAVRYTLWLVLLVKLLLPPSLALPTGVAWWLLPAARPANPHTTRFVVSYDTDAALSLPPQPIPAFAPPPRPLPSAAALAILAWSTFGTGLLVWLVVRWRQVANDVRRAAPAPAWLGELFAEAKSSISLRRNVRVRLTDQAMSPAVCGLFRPVILLPQSLVQKLPPAQLRGVLLHELIHLRRGDVWVNCAQTLVQIVYWWHPLLWFANARIRRLREEAVDDAVMLTLRDDAETYAPTLLEVAKLAFHRPLASLGLVGILESRSALRQRIERLVNFRAPRQAGLTLVSLCGICIFSAAALPMSEAPAPSSDASNVDRKENVPDKVVEADRLVRDAKLLYEMSKFDEAEKRLTSALAMAPENQAAHYYLNLVQAAKVNRPWLSGIARTSPGRKDIVDKLNRIRFDQVSWPDGLPLSEVLRNLSDQTRLRDPDRKGINFTFHTNAPGLPEATLADVAVDASSINVKLTLIDIPLVDLLDAIVLVADHPIQYSILDDGVVFSTRDSAPLETRTFKVDTNVFLANLQKLTGLKTNVVSAAVHQFVSNIGVDLSAPKSVYFNETHGVLFLHATKQDLDAVEKALQVLNYTPPPQIHIKARFIVVPREITNDLGAYFIPTHSTNLAGILTEHNFQVVLHTLKQNKGTEIVAEPEVTTSSGRRTQMRATDIVTMVTNFVVQEMSTNSAVIPQTAQVELGPVLDTIATVQADGHAIDLTIIATFTGFLGYGKTTNTTPFTTSAGTIVEVPTVLPRFQVGRAADTNLKLWDGQTVVLGKLPRHFFENGREINPAPDYFRTGNRTGNQPDEVDKEMLVFITVTLVDPAGNRLHSSDEVPKNSVPLQDSL